MIRPFVKSLLASFALMSAAAGGEDLSKYRNFQLGADLATVAKQAGQDPAEAKTIHRRPALIQELAWRPPPTSASSPTEPVKDVVFSFYDGQLFRIVIQYDHYEIDGMTAGDLVEAISAQYGIATKPPDAPKSIRALYGDQETALARWQDARYRFELVRFSYGRDFKLVGTLRSLEASVESATTEAARLDLEDAPQREAARLAKEEETERARLEKARLANKAKFKP